MEDVIKLEDIAARLSSISWDILSMLGKSEELTYTDIKNKLKLSQDKSTKEIARLEGPLLIESKRDLIDSRVLKFKLTEHGLNILKYKK